MFERFTERARLVLDRAREEAERAGHRYLGPEHLLLGVLAEGHSAAVRALRASGVDLAAARAALRGLAGRGVVPQPLPSNAELLGTWGSTWTRSAAAASRRSAPGRWGRRPGG